MWQRCGPHYEKRILTVGIDETHQLAENQVVGIILLIEP